ncbi:5-bromo-4-chloroindolyl phosphate hydrolysis family protein [Sedimentitalea sp. JM2-8]|uniref:5-bromo-4-chloroindolyl phosphate hydrolysis family protein n=1 Tax=Sedimentitalea xiamensis TaxID=3050037 RepID=A0ABT7FEW7_9RHOB|nr:5-bromo-4-chloroindolyl phosphate hydrolysis family protein [Sedimentitalea xiamensis]MDK3073658.1 5-bromo-4-chloroindolyl phosphate hydrolysis family protein [Sedimentitalea xiamensis]
MARRFGGKYSPDGSPADHPAPPRGAFDGARVDPVGARANILFIPVIPLVFLSLGDGAVGLALGLVAAGLLTFAAFLLREGLRAEAEFHARKVARRPAFPRKMAASVLTGLGIALAAYKTEPGLLAPLLYGAAATGLHGLSFGIDPMKDKGMEGIDSFQQDRVARVVEEAESRLSDMSDAIKRAGDRQMEARVERFQTTARDLFRTVEEDPRDLTGARKYLTVYLQGARDATVKFADVYARGRDPQARADYTALLDDLEQNFAARTRKMLSNDHTDLTVEIEVLRDRLRREGVRTDPQ